MNKFIKALARHELALNGLAAATSAIGIELVKCPISQKADSGVYTEEEAKQIFTDSYVVMTHLHDALTESVVSYDYYEGEQRRRPNREEIQEGLEAMGCQHCLEAWRLVLERKKTRQELGIARRLIRHYGKQAILMVAKDDN